MRKVNKTLSAAITGRVYNIIIRIQHIQISHTILLFHNPSFPLHVLILPFLLLFISQ